MNLTNYYWYFKSAVPSRICDEIVKYSKSIQDQLATTGGYGDPKKLNQKQIKDLKKKRDSDIVWLNERWIYKEVQPYVHQANASAGWDSTKTTVDAGASNWDTAYTDSQLNKADISTVALVSANWDSTHTSRGEVALLSGNWTINTLFCSINPTIA